MPHQETKRPVDEGADSEGMKTLSNGPMLLDQPLAHRVVVLPSRVNGDVGIYTGRLAQLVKQLRASGVDAAYLHDSEHRQWHVLMGDVPTELVIGIISSLAATGIVGIIASLRKALSPSSEVRARVLRQLVKSDGAVDNSWFEYQGTAEGFLGALAQLDGEGKEKTDEH